MTTHESAGESLCNRFNLLTTGCARHKIYEREIWEFFKAGFVEADLALVVQYIISENRKNDCQYSLAFGKLIRDLPRFNDILSLATERAARMKAKTRTPREQSLYELRRADEPPKNQEPVRFDREAMARAIKNLGNQ